jgi:hypothetical protein
MVPDNPCSTVAPDHQRLLDWLARYDEAVIVTALRAWCRRNIDGRIDRLGDRAGFRIVYWHGAIYGWFWSSGRPLGHRLYVSPSVVFSARTLEMLLSLGGSESLEVRLSLVAELTREAVSSGVQPSADRIIATTAPLLARSRDGAIGPIALAGLIVTSQAVGRQVAALARATYC